MPDHPPCTLTVALVSEVFHDDADNVRLVERLSEAKSRGADIAVLPEIPLNPWSPAFKEPQDEDCETLGGPRCSRQQDAARSVGIGLVGGAILKDDASGLRYNTALLIRPDGEIDMTYRKAHLPDEEGFWEPYHYEHGDAPPEVSRAFGMPIGLQICSDVNRPEGSHILGALGAQAILIPRATELVTWDRWRTVLRANALTSCCYVLSTNRPAPEYDVLIGGPSIAIAPNGKILAESTDPLTVVTLESDVVGRSKIAYPGHVVVRPGLYAKAWQAIADGEPEAG